MVFVNNLHGYKIVLTSKAEKKLKEINKKDANKITLKLKELTEGAINLDVKKLQATQGYRLRYRDYRIIYKVEEKIITVLVIDIELRKEVYKNL